MSRFIPVTVESRILGEDPKEFFVSSSRIILFTAGDFSGSKLFLERSGESPEVLNVTETPQELASLVNS